MGVGWGGAGPREQWPPGGQCLGLGRVGQGQSRGRSLPGQDRRRGWGQEDEVWAGWGGGGAVGRGDRVPAQRPRSGLGSGCWGLALSGLSGYRQQSAQLTPDGAVTPGVGKTNPGQQLSGGPATLPASRLGSPAGAQGRVLACPSRPHCLMAPPGLSGLAFSCFSGAQIPSLPWGSTPMAATPNTQASLVRRWSSLGLGAGPAWTPRGAWSRRVHPAAEACVLPRPGSLEEVRGWAAGRAGLPECLNPAGRPTSSAISHGQLPRLQSGPI